jgi:hypothetical protein
MNAFINTTYPQIPMGTLLLGNKGFSFSILGPSMVKVLQQI